LYNVTLNWEIQKEWLHNVLQSQFNIKLPSSYRLPKTFTIVSLQ